MGTRKYISTTVVVVSILLLLSASQEQPESTVEAFYTTYIRYRQPGLPSGKNLERLTPFLSDRLNELIRRALAYQERFIRSHPDEPAAEGRPPVSYKPPFIDGDFFSTMFEGPTSFRISRTTKETNGKWHVTVDFSYEPDGVDWSDVVVVVRQRGKYVIEDVIYSGAGPFNPPGRLVHSLRIPASEN